MGAEVKPVINSMDDPLLERFRPQERCEHLNFDVHANVARIEKDETDKTIVAYSVDLRLHCRDCGLPFEWVGLPLGFSHYQPTVSIDGQEMRVPAIPLGGKVTEGLAGFRVTMQAFPEKEPTRQ
jgi:hypothetical protein